MFLVDKFTQRIKIKEMGENLGVLGHHIQKAYNEMSNVLSGFTLLGQKLTSTQALGEGTKEELETIPIWDRNRYDDKSLSTPGVD